MTRVKAGDFGKKGWELTIYCLLVYFFCMGSTGTMNMLVLELNKLYGWNKTLLYSYSTIGAILCVITYYFLGIMHNKGKINLRTGAFLCGLVAAVLIFLWSVCGGMTALLFTIIASVTHLFVQAWGRFFNDNLVQNWFPLKKGAVMGWVTVGLPVGSAMGVKIYNWMYALTGGYVACYILFAVIFLVLSLWGYFSFRNYPEELGCYPDNDTNMTREKADALLQEGKEMAAKSPWTPMRTLKCWQVWVLALGLAMTEFFAKAVGQVIGSLVDAGYTTGQAANMMLFTALCAGVCSILWGVLDARVGPRKATLCVFLTALICGICRFIGTKPLIWVSLVCLGAVLGGGPNFVVSMCSSLWGRYDFKNVFGTVLAISTCFASFGSTVMSAVAEATNYGVAFLVQSLFCVFGFILIAFFIKDDFPKKCEEKWAQEEQTTA